MMRRLGSSLLKGFLTSSLIFLVASLLSKMGIPYLLGAYGISGAPLSFLLVAVAPSSLIDWLYPDGESPSAVSILFVSAFIQSAVLLTILFYKLSKKKQTNNSLKADEI